jgi:acyl transferase domain-containing protein/NADPH:quinone reductase-like Zn-dependent oxidoreductase/SAM-dependent methyltransferase/acyl carrier protein
MHKEGIAIIGIGCRFPGGVNDVEAFWKLLAEGRDAVCEVPPDRWNIERFYDAEPGLAGKSIAKRGGFLDSIDQYDPQFFGISPREAPYVDPQQRLVLETAWEAIEDAGIVLDLEKGTDIGVYVGVSHTDYQVIQGTPFDSAGIGAHSSTGSAHSIAANRISYSLNLTGPSVAMDTACSSALTAVHAACEYIWTGRGHTALAGGVTVMITPGGFIGFSQASMLSPDGMCKAFDADANGFVRAEGAGMVMLKKLSQAIADGDPIQGVILGTSTNQDGHTNGISLPSPEAQARLVKDACKDAGISPSEIGYIEAHGTGTAVGDPIEATALSDALCEDRAENAPLAMGSVKTNLGHMETAAGVAGLVKALLVLKHGKIPPSLHFKTPNPHIDFKALKLRIPVEMEDFPESYEVRMAGVNSFGFGGANSHVILAEAPNKPHVKLPASAFDRPWPLVLSARSEEALKATAYRLSTWLEDHEKSNGTSPVLPDLCYTLGARRNHHQHRLTMVAKTAHEAIATLNAFGVGSEVPNVRSGFSPRRETAARVGFVMSGQGPQWWGMGRELMKNEPVFRKSMEACAAALKPWAKFSLLEELGRDEKDSKMSMTEIAQPAIFAMQVSLSELWKSWGVQPAAIVGHSVGEIAAACVAGVLSLEEGAKVIALRARFMNECARGAGTMLAVGLDEESALAVIARHDRVVSIAAFNGPRSLTLSGPKESLEKIRVELDADSVFARFVRVDHPFHHAYMQPAADELVAALAELEPREETVPFFSTVTGDRISGKECDAGHWGRGIRQAVMFAPAVNALADFGVDVWLEITAHPALSLSIQECLGARNQKAPVVASARRDREHESMLEAALELHRACVDLDFKGMTPSRHQLALPTYAWDKARWWNESPDWREGRLGAGGKGLLDIRLPRATPTWIARLDNRHMAFLKDHKVESHVIFPGAGFVELILEAGAQYFEGRPFAVEDFEIRKPLILTENPSGVVLEVTYEPNERTFTIQSKFDTGAAWSVHVVGSMRGERTESLFNATTWEGATEGLTSLDVTDFYQHMSDLGLRYGDEFRAVRELWAAGGKAAGRVALSENIAHRAGEYCLHPVLLDGALHTFSAGSKTVEDRKAKMKLPVRFGRILYLRSPGAVTRVQAKVVQFNDEFIEGNIGLYDESGAPCVLVDGFRAVSMAAARRAGTSGTRDLLYHVDWERTASVGTPATLTPVPLADLKEAAQKTLEEVIAVRGKANLEATMAAEDDLAAAQIARGLRQMAAGLKADAVWTVDSLKVAAPMQRVYHHLVNDLTKRGLLAVKGTGHVPTATFDAAANDATEVLKTFVDQNPGHLPEGMLVNITCAELGPILRGEKDAVQVLFGGSNSDLLDQFYGDGLLSSHWMAAITSAVNEAAKNLPEGRGLRILEVGAGTGGLSAYLLPLLPRGLHSYTFTDVSAGFFSVAGQKLAAFPEVEFKVFNLEQPPAAQGYEAGTYDLVIGTNVIHAVADVRATLGYLHEVLKPGGSLVFMDVATPQLWTESVFGLTSGWWHLTDRDLRPDQPLMQRPEWEAAMKTAGFVETTSIPGLHGPRGGEGQIGLLGRKAWTETPAVTQADAEPSLPLAPEASWLVFADKGGLGDQLVAQLKAAGVRVRTARRGAAYAAKGDDYTLRADTPEDWMTLVTSYADDTPPERMTYLWTLDEPAGKGEGDAALMGIDALLHLTQAIENTTPAVKLRMDLITRGAQPAGQHMGLTNVAQAPSIGVFRVILSEHPNFACRGLDLPPEASAEDAALLWRELLQEHGEREIAIRGEARYVQRIKRGLPVKETVLDRKIPLRLESRERGMLDTLKLTPFTLPVCGDGEVLIEVKAAGMNFRDVLKALALYPAETPDARIFGDEVGGIVLAIGKDIKHVAVGDRVFGLAVYGLATHTLARGGDVVRIPDHLSFEGAATLPVVFMTSWHALNNVARMRKGETILVHAGAGGVGMSAIQIALHLGCEVIATAGSASKRALLQTLGVKHVIDSRRADFADAVMDLTNRKGVDVVLNALAAEAIPMGLSCLSEFGRFIEIGKRDIYQNSRIPLWHLRKNASFHVVAMDAVFGGDEELTRRLLGELVELVEQGALRPLPFRAYPASRVDAAFRLMAAGKHTGKVVVTFTDAFVNRRGEAPAPGFEVKAEGTYLITGGFGGFGRVLSQWLVDCGARHLALASRSGASTPEAKAFVTQMESQGVKIQILKGDAGEPEDITRMLREIEAAKVPLKGVFHLAMVIDDAPMGVLNRERMRTVLAPKALGAWKLHEGTLDLNLDCFVMFSSISSVFGNPAQSNYSGANAFLDSLAHHRRALGLPALAVNWGVLGGEGYVARNEKVAEFLARQGTSAITPGEVVSLLETFLTAGSAQVAALRVDWAKWRQSFRGLQENPLLEHIFASGVESAESGGMTGDWRAKIDAASAEDRAGIIAQALREVVGSVLRVKPDSLRDDQPLTDLGLDSLMGVEIENLIESTIGVALPPTSLMRARTIGQLAALIGEHLGGATGTAAKAPAAPAVVEAPTSVDEVDLDAISDDDIASLLDDVTAAEETPAPAAKAARKAGA